MPIAVNCPTCGQRLKIPDEAAGKIVTCPNCSARLTLPTSPPGNSADPLASEQRHHPQHDVPPRSNWRHPDNNSDHQDTIPGRTKFCHECGSRIHVRAEICPKCGMRQPHTGSRQLPGVDARLSEVGKLRDSIKIPLLISAISNIVVSLFWVWAFFIPFWFCSCPGVVFIIPMIILCIFEFDLWSKADRLPLRRVGSQAKTLAIFEIMVGLINLPTLICGIVILINSGNLENREDERFD